MKYVRHDFNQGVQFASNTGYRFSNGKYLAFIGDDDVWIKKNKIENLICTRAYRPARVQYAHDKR